MVVQLVIQGHEQCVCFPGTDDCLERRNVFQYNYHEILYCVCLLEQSSFHKKI